MKLDRREKDYNELNHQTHSDNMSILFTEPITGLTVEKTLEPWQQYVIGQLLGLGCEFKDLSKKKKSFNPTFSEYSREEVEERIASVDEVLTLD